MQAEIHQPTLGHAAIARPGCLAMLDAAEPLAGIHALVICDAGVAGLDALCGLIARGCDAAAELSPSGRVPAEPAEVVLAPAIGNLAEASRVILLARRFLLPCGRIVLRCDEGLGFAIRRLLLDAGFAPVALRKTGDDTIVSADLPMFGLVRVARHA